MRGRGGPAGAAEAAGLPGREQPGPGQPGAPSAGLDRPVSVPRSPPPQSPAARRPRRWGGGRAWVSAAPRGPPWGLAERRVASIWCQLFRGDGGGGWWGPRVPDGRAGPAGGKRFLGAGPGRGRRGLERAWASPAGAAQLGPRARFHVRPQLLTLMQPRGARSEAWLGKGRRSQGRSREKEGRPLPPR